MPLKVAVSTIPASSLRHNTGIARILEPDLQVVTIGQLKVVIEQINKGQEAFNNRLKDIGSLKVKLLIVKQFNRSRIKLKGYLIQISLKLKYKGPKIVTLLDAVIYAGMFLIGRALKWFKPYLTEYQINRTTTINLKIKYIFLSQENFKN